MSPAASIFLLPQLALDVVLWASSALRSWRAESEEPPKQPGGERRETDGALRSCGPKEHQNVQVGAGRDGAAYVPFTPDYDDVLSHGSICGHGFCVWKDQKKKVRGGRGRRAPACASWTASFCARASGLRPRSARRLRPGRRVGAPRRRAHVLLSRDPAHPPSQIKRTWGTGKRETARAAKKAAAS